jgi:2,3-bisphosphoglycerate-dependent phosphoglycerate mutase
MTHQITFLRHGQSIANHEGIVQGHLDYPLSELGRQQADALASAWAREARRYDLILSSPLQRARQTAAILASRLPAPIELDPAWKERYLGNAQGTAIAAFLEASRQSPPRPPFAAAYGDGEGTWELYLRAAAAVQRLVRRSPGRYLVVSHGGILNAALRAILGLAPMPGLPIRIDLGNCGYADMSLQADGAWTLNALCNPSGGPAPNDESDR